MPAILVVTMDDCLGCCETTCHDLWGDTLDVVISGFVDCGCIPGDSGGSFAQTAHTDITGSFTATWDAGSSSWKAIIGTIDITQYSDADCSIETNVFTRDVQLKISCVSNFVTVTISIINPPSGAATIFGHAAGALDAALNNQVGCTGNTFASITTVTVSLP